MATHAFVDESSRGGYLLCAVVVLPTDLGATRRVLKSLCKPGQRRIHMKHESDARRREIIGVVARLGVSARVYRAGLTQRSERHARDDCFRSIEVLDVGP